MREVLAALGIGPDALLGHGGEAEVYALDDARVARIHRAGAANAHLEARNALLDELGRSSSKVPFALPRVIERFERAGHFVSIEQRLQGRAMMQVLTEQAGTAREELVRAYLDAAAQIGDLLVPRPWYGDLFEAPGTLRTDTFRAFLRGRAAQNLARAPEEFRGIDPGALADALPEPDAPALVHLDVFPGNVLADGAAVTAVIDFGTLSVIGNRRFDPLTAVAYLTPHVSPTANDADRAVAQAWLREQELDALYPPALRWITAFWSAARGEPRLVDWARSVLLDPTG